MKRLLGLYIVCNHEPRIELFFKDAIRERKYGNMRLWTSNAIAVQVARDCD